MSTKKLFENKYPLFTTITPVFVRGGGQRAAIDKLLANVSIEGLTRSPKGRKGPIESTAHYDARVETYAKFQPKVDFTDPANFAFYGLAELYYQDSIERIYNTFPYDGSEYEKEAWHISSSYLDVHLFEKEYPRTNGHVNFSPAGWGTRQGSLDYGYGLSSTKEYIYLSGGPHTDPEGNYLSGTANVYNATKTRESNLKLNASLGNTIEFWLKSRMMVSL